MVTVNKKIALNTGTATFELMGLSTDTKPTGTFSGYNVGVNSVYLELDTGKLYYFKGSEWEEMSMSGGGAGLPAVTDEDNGKVLGVVDGQWDKMDIGGDEYETVAEIEVGTMEEEDGLYLYGIPSEARPAIATTDLNKLYIDTHKLVKLDAETYGYNIDPQTHTPITSPAYMLYIDSSIDDGYAVVGIATYPDRSNTTVKILKKVYSDVDLFATFGGTLQEPTLTMTSTAAEIIAAAVAFSNGKTVKLRANIYDSDLGFNGFQFICHHANTDRDNEAVLGLFGVYSDVNNNIFNYLNVLVVVHNDTVGADINISTPNSVSP